MFNWTTRRSWSSVLINVGFALVIWPSRSIRVQAPSCEDYMEGTILTDLTPCAYQAMHVHGVFRGIECFKNRRHSGPNCWSFLKHYTCSPHQCNLFCQTGSTMTPCDAPCGGDIEGTKEWRLTVPKTGYYKFCPDVDKEECFGRPCKKTTTKRPKTTTMTTKRTMTTRTTPTTRTTTATRPTTTTAATTTTAITTASTIRPTTTTTAQQTSTSTQLSTRSTTTTRTTEKPEGLALWDIILIVLAVLFLLVIIIAVIVLCTRRRRRRRQHHYPGRDPWRSPGRGPPPAARGDARGARPPYSSGGPGPTPRYPHSAPSTRHRSPTAGTRPPTSHHAPPHAAPAGRDHGGRKASHSGARGSQGTSGQPSYKLSSLDRKPGRERRPSGTKPSATMEQTRERSTGVGVSLKGTGTGSRPSKGTTAAETRAPTHPSR